MGVAARAAAHGPGLAFELAHFVSRLRAVKDHDELGHCADAGRAPTEAFRQIYGMRF
jgi:hypothetical protein